jgi:HAD superfamily hydrolase (TIGR01509 family)
MPFRPQALLLDFGGVIADGERTPGTVAALAARLADLVAGEVPADRIRADVIAGTRAYTAWRKAMARPYAPPELTHAQFWGDFVAADWPEPARQAVLAEASDLARRWTSREGWFVRDGVFDLFDAADAAGLPMAVVSNVLSGASVREYFDELGITSRFAALVFSDEAGVRKPNPEMVHLATTALGVTPARVWFVGDSLSRDILCCRRAGVGCAVLVRPDRRGAEAKETDDVAGVEPDVVCESMVDVHRLLADALG